MRVLEGLPWEKVLAEVQMAAKNMEQLLQPKFKLSKVRKGVGVVRLRA